MQREARLDPVHENARMIDLNKAKNITIRPDHELLSKLRNQVGLATGRQREDLREQFESEYRSIMHTSLRAIAEQMHMCSKTHGFRSDWLNVPEKLMLIITEMSEAMEAYRQIKPLLLTMMANNEKGVPLPAELEDSVKHVKNFREEMADTLIRLLDLMYALDIDIESVTASKMATNELREHKHGKYR